MRQVVDSAPRPVTPDTVRKLLERDREGPVISVFLDLDPARFATPDARTTQLASLEARVRDIGGELNAADRSAMETAFARVRAHLLSQDFSPAGASWIAVYVDATDLFEIFALRSRVDPGVEIGPGPIIGPLKEELTVEPRWGVLLVNRRSARFLVGPADALQERGEVSDDVHGRHKQGGWSQARYQRSVEEEAAGHVRRAVEAFESMDRRLHCDHLVIGCPQELETEVRHAMSKPTLEKLICRVDGEVELSSVEDVQERIAPVVAAERAEAESEALDALAERIGRGGRAAVGVEAVRSALIDRRVERVLCQEGTEVPDDLLELALEQDADVLVIHRPMEMNGPLAALLRF